MVTIKEIYGITFIYTWILYVGAAVFMDTFFGLWRAVRFREWNSSFGINGLIRKACMMACVAFMVLIDAFLSVDLVQAFPDQAIYYIKIVGVNHVGFSEFFGILFVAYEIVSILKNMCLCGLPVKWVWIKVYKFLGKFTDELPDTEDMF